MGQNVTLTKALAAASANCICLSQAGLAGASLTINGALANTPQPGMFGTPPVTAILDTQRRVLITSAGNDSGITFTVYGHNDNGAPINTTVQGANGTVATPIDFADVYAVIPSGTTASTVTVGTNTVGSTPWVMANRHVTPMNVGLGLEFPSGNVTASAEYTLAPILSAVPSPLAGGAPAAAYAPNSPNPNAETVNNLSSISVAGDATVTEPIYAWRLTVNSGTGTAVLSGQQAGIAQG